MKPWTPAYCTVSHGGGHYTIKYRLRDRCSRSAEWCSAALFDGLPAELPVIRFDRATTDAVLESLRGLTPEIEGITCPLGPQITLDAYLDRERALGIPVQLLAAYRAELAGVLA
jgi:hypothetical protein